MNENKEFENKTTSIHTLESDLASAVRDENYGKNIIKIVTDPNKNSMVIGNGETPRKGPGIRGLFTKKNIFILLAIIIVLSAGGVILYILNQAKNAAIPKDDAEVTATTTMNNEVPVIKNSDVLNPEIIQSANFSNLNRFEILSEIQKIKALLVEKKINPGNNVGIGTNLDIVRFFEKIRYSGDESFLRSLNSEYAFGLYSLKGGQFETYLLIRVDNFDLAFKSILDWEKYMGIDLKDIFSGNNEIFSSTTQATTTAQPAKTYQKKNTVGFVDRVLKNYDIREYVKNEDNVDIIYGFINNKYLLITSGESSFIDIKDRLLKENILR